MEFHHIYSLKRTGSDKIPVGARSGFQRDFDRLIFSSAFRRLQNKTQVFPLPGTAFVHNRLTHSLEVASVGRSLGKMVGERIADQYKSSDSEPTSFTGMNWLTLLPQVALRTILVIPHLDIQAKRPSLLISLIILLR